MKLTVILIIMLLSACTKHAGVGQWWENNSDQYDTGQVTKPEIK